MTSAGNTISAHVAKQLRAIRFELLSPASAHLVWTEVLTEEERQQLGGDLNSAYYQYQGAVGIYTQARGVEPDFALVEIAQELGWLTEHKARRLVEALGGRAVRPMVPRWNRDRRELTFGHDVIRRVRSDRAARVIQLLNAFERQGWPDRIADPLPDGPDPINLRDAVRITNIGLRRIRFETANRGHDVVWKLA
jgi:hypothetical protein